MPVYMSVYMSVYHAVYLSKLTVTTLTQELAKLYDLMLQHVDSVYVLGPAGIRVTLTDMVSTYVTLTKIVKNLLHSQKW